MKSILNVLDTLFGGRTSAEDTQIGSAYAEPLSRRDFTRAAPLLLAAIARDDARAMCAYAAMCAVGHGVNKNTQEAYCWFLQSATQGDVCSQVALGMCLAGGVGTPMNRKEAAYWLYRAEKSGSLRAIEFPGNLAYRDHSIVGPHFTEDELIDLLYRFKKQMMRRSVSKSFH